MTLTLSLAPSHALADALADARTLFARGRELRLHGECAAAIPLFRRAFDVYTEGLGSLRNLAECEETLGHRASARRAWLDLQRRLLPNKEPKYDGWQEDAEQGAVRLASKVATLTVDVAGDARERDQAEITVNGEQLPAAFVGVPLGYDPGRYIVRMGGHGLAQERAVDLAGGESKRLLFSPSGVPEAVASSTLLEPLPPGITPPWETRHVGAWTAVGVAIASFVGVGIAGLEYQSSLGDLNGRCPAQRCPSSVSPSEVEGIRDRGRAASTLVNMFLVTGAVATGTAIVLFAWDHPRSASAALVVSPGSVSAVGRF